MKRLCVLGGVLALLLAPDVRSAQPVVRTSVAPEAPRFGDVVTYTVQATVGAGALDSTDITTAVGVLTRISPPRTTRSTEGGVAHVTVTERLACLVAQCVARSGQRTVRIPPARVRVQGVAVRGAATPLQIQPRVPLRAVRASTPAFRRASASAPVTQRVDPGRARDLLVACGGLLVLAGTAGLAWPLAWRSRRSDPTGHVDALRRAVRLLRESSGRNGPDRRRAASHVGRLVGEPSLAIEAARVAWSRGDPAPGDVTALAESVEQAPGRHE